MREKARTYLAALTQSAVAEYGTLTPAGLRSLADLLERGAAAAREEVATAVGGSR